MKKGSIIKFFLVAGIVAGVFVYLRPPPDPVYDGRPLSEWMIQASAGIWPRTATPADEAIRQIGTNAFPMIIHLLRARDSGLKMQLLELCYKTHLLQSTAPTSFQAQMRAIAACYALGPIAKPLAPFVAEALPHMELHAFAEQWLASLGPDAEAAIPSLIAILKDKNNPVRSTIPQTLAQIAIRQPDRVRPVLNQCLCETNDVVSSQAAAALKILDSAPWKTAGR